VDDAFAAAKAAQGDWAALPPRAHGKYLKYFEEAAHEIDVRHYDIVAALAVEAGATNYWAQGIVAHAALCVREAARCALGDLGRILSQDDPGMINHVYRKPVGTVAIVTPWNSLINLTMPALAPALALGNTMVVKPAN